MQIKWETVLSAALHRAREKDKGIFLDFFNPQ